MTGMAVDIRPLVLQISDNISNNAFRASDALARVGFEEVVLAMIAQLSHENTEARVLAARTLGQIGNNMALEPMMEAIKSEQNRSIAGELMVALEGLDVADCYVELFQLYLNGSNKVSLLAKEQLDYREFHITEQVVEEVVDLWCTYASAATHDEVFNLRKQEAESMIDDIRHFLS
jgi:HEAT repeat protein